ncbi:hypothetical protein [Mesobacillus subterraneus]|uniref:Uncharacterized protein n=1 Tax=Mesobacillus subterraneus TaxID=285983 RepID=A0A427TVG9_9BACI|nr:hypothetical protein [Mesobacillus subterraneus]RSD28394.1 hypothetical protein EJA10_04735 [Mesobacillus subterraneus]
MSLIATGCSQSVEDTENYSGVIGEAKALGYEYRVTKEREQFNWMIGYKGKVTMIEETSGNKEGLERFMLNVNRSQTALGTLLISLFYLVIVVITTLIILKKNRKMLKNSAPVITLLAGIAIYVAIEASTDLMGALQEAKYFYTLISK